MAVRSPRRSAGSIATRIASGLLVLVPAIAGADQVARPIEMREIAPGVAMPFQALGDGLPAVPAYRYAKPPPLRMDIPDGFHAIFNGRDIDGWHVSKTSRHGTAPDVRVRQGVIMGMQGDLGQGGLLMTDKAYRNFELSLETKPDWGADSGIFFRTTEEGAGYQVQLDYVSSDRSVTMGPGLNLGGVAGEGGVTFGPQAAQSPQLSAADMPTRPTPDYSDPPIEPVPSYWKREAWNTVRVRVTGDVPHVMVWINGTLVSDVTDTANHAVHGATSGRIALQIHGGWQRWRPGAVLRWKNVAIKELP